MSQETVTILVQLFFVGCLAFFAFWFLFRSINLETENRRLEVLLDRECLERKRLEAIIKEKEEAENAQSQPG